MHRLIYVSRSITPFPTDIWTILESSQKNNAKFGLTGAMCFLDGVYCQYLEGDAVILEDLYRKILSDPRHKDIKLIEFTRITERFFKNWAMALVTWNDQTRFLFKTLNQLDALDLHAITLETAAATFQAFSRSASWLELAPPTQIFDPTTAQVILKAV